MAYESIKAPIVTFKSLREEGNFLAQLQKGLKSIMPILLNIFQAHLVLGYIPVACKTVKVIFTPKLRKREKAKSFRPISLSSFLLKALERLLDIYLRKGTPMISLIHNLQHASHSGKSTDVALHHLVSR